MGSKKRSPQHHVNMKPVVGTICFPLRCNIAAARGRTQLPPLPALKPSTRAPHQKRRPGPTSSQDWSPPPHAGTPRPSRSARNSPVMPQQVENGNRRIDPLLPHADAAWRRAVRRSAPVSPPPGRLCDKVAGRCAQPSNRPRFTSPPPDKFEHSAAMTQWCSAGAINTVAMSCFKIAPMTIRFPRLGPRRSVWANCARRRNTSPGHPNAGQGQARPQWRGADPSLARTSMQQLPPSVSPASARHFEL